MLWRKFLVGLLFLTGLVKAQESELCRIIINEQEIIPVKNFRLQDKRIYLLIEEAFEGLGLKWGLSEDQRWLFFKLGEQLVTVDLKLAKAVMGTRELAFSGVLNEGKDLYLSEDFFGRVYSEFAGVKVKIEYPEVQKPLGENHLIGFKLPEKFKRDPVDIVVIDPGHGGESFGANTPDGWREKDLTLRIARKVKDELKKVDGLKVYLTREEDKYLDLDSRTAFANKLGADLFLSIHINGAEVLSANGFETFFLSLNASDEQSRKLALWENLELSGTLSNSSEMLKEKVSDIELILGDLAQNEHLAESDFLARLIQKNLELTMQQTTNRGIRQAPFRVLMTANMPAVLVEVGFLTNPDDRRNITNPAMQDKIARALAQSILQFRDLKAKQLGMGDKNEKKQEKAGPNTQSSN